MLMLVAPLIVYGAIPGKLPGSLAVENPPNAGVSAWGLGLVYVLPWLLGIWLSRARELLERIGDVVHRVVLLDWLFAVLDATAARVIGGIHWLGRVGEGEGWWGWALIILALGAMLYLTR
jgi:hypothetical protein